MDAKARKHNAVARYKHGDGFSRRDVRIELEVDPRPAVKLARDLRPFMDRAEAIAHTVKVGTLPYVSSKSAAKPPYRVCL